MSTFTYAPESNNYAAWQNMFDPSTIVIRNQTFGNYAIWFGQLKDGNLFWLHVKDGVIVALNASDYTVNYLEAELSLPVQPLLDMYMAGKFSPGKWVSYLTSGADTVLGSDANDRLNGGAGDDVIYGDIGNDKLNGNTGNDTLYGGLGNDTLQGSGGDDRLEGGAGRNSRMGGDGADAFVFDVLENGSLKDKIKDFTSGSDHIELSTATYAALAAYGPGPLDSSELTYGAAATEAGQHLIYDQSNGALYYDADGAGGYAQVQIATLTNLAALEAGDILLV